MKNNATETERPVTAAKQVNEPIDAPNVKPESNSKGISLNFDHKKPGSIRELAEWLLYYDIDHEEAICELAGAFLHIRSLATPDKGYLRVQDFCDDALAQLYQNTIAFDRAAAAWADSMQMSPIGDIDEPSAEMTEEKIAEHNEELDELAAKISSVLEDERLPEPLYNHFKTALADFFNHEVDTTEIEAAENSKFYIRMLLRGHQQKMLAAS